jgi:hypothetical protein
VDIINNGNNQFNQGRPPKTHKLPLYPKQDGIPQHNDDSNGNESRGLLHSIYPAPSLEPIVYKLLDGLINSMNT